jgi:hypothetical protein
MLNEFKSEVVGCYIMPQLGKYEAAMGVLEGLGCVCVSGWVWVGGCVRAWVGGVRACVYTNIHKNVHARSLTHTQIHT